MSQSIDPFARLGHQAVDIKRRLDEIAADVLRVAALLPNHDDLRDVERRFMDLMVRADWPPPLDVPLSDVVELVQEHERHPGAVEATIDEWVIAHCSDDGLRSALDSWRSCPLCRRRMQPLEAAVRAHLQDEYFCSIPVLLAQTEGLVCDFAGSDTDHHLTAKMRKRVRTSLETGVENGIGVHIGRALREYYLEAVMASLAPGSAPVDLLRRNLILHGADTGYGTRTMSWKALLLFDTILESLNVAILEEDKTQYHLPGCELYRKDHAKGVTYVPVARPSGLTGRSPCEACGAPDLGTNDE